MTAEQSNSFSLLESAPEPLLERVKKAAQGMANDLRVEQQKTPEWYEKGAQKV